MPLPLMACSSSCIGQCTSAKIFTKDRFKVFLTYRGHVFDRNGEPRADPLWRDAGNGRTPAAVASARPLLASAVAVKLRLKSSRDA